MNATMELVNSTSWGGNPHKGDTQITTDVLLNKLHVNKFMSRNGYDGLIPRMELWCETFTIENKAYIRLNQLERITWPTFIEHMREYVDVELKALPL
jgi:hypothetical protein